MERTLCKTDFSECTLAHTLALLGDRWTLLILRDAFGGAHNFEAFHASLGIARNILSDRLVRLVERGVLERRPDASDRRKIEYLLTLKGRALLPALVALRQWGERWESFGPINPTPVDARDGLPIAEIAIHAADGRTLAERDILWVDIRLPEIAEPDRVYS